MLECSAIVSNKITEICMNMYLINWSKVKKKKEG